MHANKAIINMLHIMHVCMLTSLFTSALVCCALLRAGQTMQIN